jgi:hypothetical protein
MPKASTQGKTDTPHSQLSTFRREDPGAGLISESGDSWAPPPDVQQAETGAPGSSLRNVDNCECGVSR